jgi:hypothetical protein
MRDSSARHEILELVLVKDSHRMSHFNNLADDKLVELRMTLDRQYTAWLIESLKFTSTG